MTQDQITKTPAPVLDAFPNRRVRRSQRPSMQALAPLICRRDQILILEWTHIILILSSRLQISEQHPSPQSTLKRLLKDQEIIECHNPDIALSKPQRFILSAQWLALEPRRRLRHRTVGGRRNISATFRDAHRQDLPRSITST
ncbi:hypothetical protein V5O48_015047, partial [Marasmius crinis-equi]